MSLQSESQISVLTVSFTYANYNPSGGLESPLRLADTHGVFTTQDSQGNDLEFSPEPSLKVELPERNGGLEEDDAIIRLSSVSASVQPFLNMVSGRSHPPVKVEVVEYIFEDHDSPPEAANVAHQFRGKLLSLDVNTDGEEGQFKLICLNPKQRTEKSLDSLALETCRNDFASGKVCGFNLTNALETGTVSSASGNEITITGLPSKPPGYWQAGYVDFGGHRVHIKHWRSGDDFVLTQAVPTYWEESRFFQHHSCSGVQQVTSQLSSLRPDSELPGPRGGDPRTPPGLRKAGHVLMKFIRQDISKGPLASLEAAAQQWVGTPYRPGHQQPGVGCDCRSFVLGVLDELYGTRTELELLPEDASLASTRGCAELSQKDG